MLNLLLLLAAANFNLWTSADLKAIEKSVTGKTDEHKYSGQSLAHFGNHLTSLAHREGSGQAELHAKQNDIFVVQSGEATLVVGGTIDRSKSSGPNEQRGPSISGGEKHKLSAGDIVHIPANTAHQLLIDPGKQFTYFVVKVNQ